MYTQVFWRSEYKLIKNIFDIRNIFISWCAKHEATYILTYSKTKTHTPQFSLLIIFLCLAYKIYSFIDLSYHTFGVPKQMPRWTFGGGGAYSLHEINHGLIERILLHEQKFASSLSRVFSVGHCHTSKMQTLQRYKKLSTELMKINDK